jgi:nucleotide-binding universal stress UspA family protein
MSPIRTILHPTDFSGPSDLAFRMACGLARDFGARLVVLHVAEFPANVYPEATRHEDPTLRHPALWAKVRELRPPSAGLSVEHRLADGDAAEEVLRAAGETGSDLIVLGTHGRTGLKHLLMGSVAEQVVRKAPCPVLTVKAPPAGRRGHRGRGGRHPLRPGGPLVLIRPGGTYPCPPRANRF